MNDHSQDDDQLVSRVAWLYYHENLTQADIGERLGLTRLKVNRVLQAGREQGLVQVVINTPFRDCVALEERLVRRFGLARAMVLPSPERAGRLYDAIGRPAGEYVSLALRDGQSLGVGWGNTIRATLSGIVHRNFQNISVSAIYGGVPRSPVNPFDSTAMFARKLQAKECNYVAAPMFVSTPEIRATLASQEAFTISYSEAVNVDMLLTSLGDMSPQATNLILRGVDRTRWDSLIRAGAVGEFFGRFLGADGAPLDHEMNHCSMSPDFDALCGVRHIVLVAGGLAKVPVLRVVMERRYVHVFITDQQTAEHLLDG